MVKKGKNIKVGLLPKKKTEKLVESLNLKITKLTEKNKELKKVKKAVYEAESKYRSLFEMSDDAILVIDKGKFVDCNKAVVKMLGYRSKHELLQTHPSELSPKIQPDGRDSFEKAQEMIKMALKNGSHHFEWIHTKANGKNFPVEVWLSAVDFKGKKIINTVWRDLSEKKKAENVIRRNLVEKEILLKEIHHRVKNNLQVISSLLNLQLNQVDDENARKVLLNSKNRILSMSKIHEMLYQSSDLSNIDYGKYVALLCDNLVESLSGSESQVKIKIDIKELYLNISTAIPLGLLINEIVSNALKHGIKGNGKIEVNIRSVNEKKMIMEIGDNGVGYAGGFTFDNNKTMGFQLMGSLREQLNGTLVKDKTKKGTHYTLKFERI